MKVVILAGGYGTRLAEYIHTIRIKNSLKITAERYIKALKQGKNPIDLANQQLESYTNENNWT